MKKTKAIRGASLTLCLTLLICPFACFGERADVPEAAADPMEEPEHFMLFYEPLPVMQTVFSEAANVTTLIQNEGDLASDVFQPYDVPLDAELQEYIHMLCMESGVQMELVLAIIDYESNYQKDAVSRTNDYGLMQINQCNHEWLHQELGIQNFLEPEENVKAGIYILRQHLERFQDTSKALMAYNMGATGAARLWDKGIYETTYSKAVINLTDQMTIGGKE